MKKILFFLLFCSVNSFAQRDTVTTNVEDPRGGLVIHNQVMYVSERSLGVINSFDLNTSNPSPEPYLSNLDDPNNLFIEKGVMYYTVKSNGNWSIFKIDLTQVDAEPVLILGGLEYSIWDIVVNEDRLFYIEHDYINDTEMIWRLDLLTPNPERVGICYAPFATDLTIKGDYLYFSEYLSRAVSRVDLRVSDPSPETMLLWNIYGPVGITFNDDDLYFYEVDSFRLSKIDISTITNTTNQTLTTIDSGFYGFDIHVYEDDIYATVFNPTKMVVRYNNIATDVVENLEPEVDLLVYPSPGNDYLYLKNSDLPAACRVFDINGRVLMDSEISESQGLYLGNFSPGIYYLLVKGKSIPFVVD